MNTKSCSNYVQQLEGLSSLVTITEKRALEGTDDYFTDNLNFFCKSFLITLCSYLESYLKEAAEIVINEMNARLKANPVPQNLIRWHLDKNKEIKESKFESLILSISKSDIDDSISGNVYKTINLFSKLGINLISNPDFQIKKESIGTMVAKRNNIVHYNDAASDLSLSDIIRTIGDFKAYLICIDNILVTHLLPCITSPFT